MKNFNISIDTIKKKKTMQESEREYLQHKIGKGLVSRTYREWL